MASASPPILGSSSCFHVEASRSLQRAAGACFCLCAFQSTLEKPLTFDFASLSLKFHGKGTMYLSTLRVVFVAHRKGNIAAFDLPLATMTNESFNQPIFSANNMTGTNPPLDGSECQQDIKWCLSFNEGGVGTFLPVFFRLLHEMRARMAAPSAEPSSADAAPMPQAIATQIVQAAFVDPSDPTKLYVSTSPLQVEGVPAR